MRLLRYFEYLFNHFHSLQVQVMAIGYMLLFLLGTCGNVAVCEDSLSSIRILRFSVSSQVLTTIYQMVRSRRAQLDNTLIYMVVLSCVDFGVYVLMCRSIGSITFALCYFQMPFLAVYGHRPNSGLLDVRLHNVQIARRFGKFRKNFVGFNHHRQLRN